jgi:hypothetical protein
LTGDRAVALATAPPRVSCTHEIRPAPSRQRTLTIRDSSGDRIVALVEIVSRANKASAQAVSEFVGKITAALWSGIHAAVIEIFPPGTNDPQGMHGAILDAFGDEQDRPADKPLTFASYAAGGKTVAYLQYPAIGDPVPNLPVFLTADHYVEMPLAATYAAVIRSIPRERREIIEQTLTHPPSSS